MIFRPRGSEALAREMASLLEKKILPKRAYSFIQNSSPYLLKRSSGDDVCGVPHSRPPSKRSPRKKIVSGLRYLQICFVDRRRYRSVWRIVREDRGHGRSG